MCIRNVTLCASECNHVNDHRVSEWHSCVLTHLSFLLYGALTVGMRGEPNFLRFLTKNTHAYKIQYFHI